MVRYKMAPTRRLCVGERGSLLTQILWPAASHDFTKFVTVALIFKINYARFPYRADALIAIQDAIALQDSVCKGHAALSLRIRLLRVENMSGHNTPML